MRKWLKELRIKHSMTQQNVSNSLGITQQYYNLIENGERQKQMTIDMAQKISKIFNIPIEEILANEKQIKSA